MFSVVGYTTDFQQGVLSQGEKVKSWKVRGVNEHYEHFS